VESISLIPASLLAVTVLVLGSVAAAVAALRVLRRGGVMPPAAAAPTAPAPAAAAPALPPEDLAFLRGELCAVRAEWKAHQKQLDAYLEAFEDLEESVERRRRRSAASRSKLESIEARQEAPEIDPNSREALRLRARARGLSA